MPLISDSIGRVLGKRYRLLSALGTGASAHVYLAEDVSLQRHVAVKVLQPGLAADEAFLKRFRAEARSVASLNHPHVLRVFDWGEDNDEPYLVLEYLGGGSLRDLLDRDVRLSHAQAAMLGAEVAQGLAYAHVRGLVHRDVKPANLLFDEEGRVRIADFGVARALAEAAWTEPAGAMVGTARYISPEAAEGKPVDGRADVYSLALVLYEAVTGTVPFVTDTTMGTLGGSDRADVAARPGVGPLGRRVGAGGRARRCRPPGRGGAVGPVRGAGGGSAHACAAAAGVRAAGEVGPDRRVPGAGGRRADRDEGRRGCRRGRGRDGRGGRGDHGGGGGGAGRDQGRPRRGLRRRGLRPLEGRRGRPMPAPKKRRWWRGDGFGGRRTWMIAGVALAVVLLAAGLAVAFGTNVLTPSHPTPTLANLTVAEARTSLAKVHMTLAEGRPIKSITVGSGDIVSQSPKAGVSVKEGTTVTVVVSDGPPNVTVPSLAGMTCAQATNALTAAHFKSVCAPGAYNNNVTAGVLDIWTIGSTQNPTMAPYGATITLVPSLGHEPATVPQIPQTYTFAQAQAALQAVGLTATQNNQSSTTDAERGCHRDAPASGAQAPYGSAVTVNVSTGPPTTTVPDVKGDSVQQADAALQQAGLTPSGVSGNPSSNVIGTQPSIGSTVPTGSAVQLFTH